jgi:DNA repair exonuclease SbcCD ATPase subunit
VIIIAILGSLRGVLLLLLSNLKKVSDTIRIRMIEIKNLKVESFYSLGKVNLPINNGVYLVYGYNKDITSEFNVSNGAGKTSLFNAIYQGLYNKNLKDPTGTIASVNNIYYGKPYVIEIVLNKEGNIYRIINDRNRSKIFIYKNEELISFKSLKANLDFIKNELIGFDFNVFTALTFLNQNSLNAIVDLSNQDNLLYQFFEIDKLGKIERAIKDYVKKYKEDQRLLSVKEHELVTNLSFLQNHYTIEEGLLEEINQARQQLENIRTGRLRKKLEETLVELDKLKQKINDKEKILIRIDYEKQTLLKQIEKLKVFIH